MSIQVEVAYALANKQDIRQVELPIGSNVESALQKSKLLEDYQLDMKTISVGIFSKACELTQILNSGDRVEIYRELTIDPKTRRQLLARRQR